MAEDKEITALKKRLADEGMEKIEPNIWDFEKDRIFEGYFVGVDVEVGAHHSKLYHFKTKDGGLASVWGSTVLDTRLKNVELGERVVIIYHGRAIGKSGSEYKQYEVYHGEPEAKGDEEKRA